MRSVTHVWTKDGVYVGQLFAQPGWKLGFEIEDQDHREKIRQALASVADAGHEWIEVRAGSDWRKSVEFPSPQWVAIASLMVLPPEGYRVRVVMDAEERV